MGRDKVGIHKGIMSSISKCTDDDTRRNLLGNIVICGGTTLFPGLADRISCEVKKLNKNEASVNIVALADRKYAAWKGGSILSSIMAFQQMWITRDQYNQLGPKSVHWALH
eukprot:13850099-Ditylum_brightwellii.AAC.1